MNMPKCPDNELTDISDIRWTTLSDHHTSRASTLSGVMHKTVTPGLLQIPVVQDNALPLSLFIVQALDDDH